MKKLLISVLACAATLPAAAQAQSVGGYEFHSTEGGFAETGGIGSHAANGNGWTLSSSITTSPSPMVTASATMSAGSFNTVTAASAYKYFAHLEGITDASEAALDALFAGDAGTVVAQASGNGSLSSQYVASALASLQLGSASTEWSCSFGSGACGTFSYGFALTAGQFSNCSDALYICSVGGTKGYDLAIVMEALVGEYGVGFGTTASASIDPIISLDLRSFESHGIDPSLLSFSFAGGEGNSAAPEPTSWALMLAGFGAIGCLMLRRKVHLATA